MSAGHGSFETMKRRAKIASHIQLKHFPKNDTFKDAEDERYRAARYYDTSGRFPEKRFAEKLMN